MNVHVLESSGRQVQYTYDALYRLTQEAITDPLAGKKTFDYKIFFLAFGFQGVKSFYTDRKGKVHYE